MTTWPENQDAVVRWVRASMRPDDDVEVQGLEGVRVSAALDGAALEQLTVDATRASLTIRFLEGTSGTAERDREPRELSRVAGGRGSLRLVASPVQVQGFPVELDAQVQNAPVDWVEYAQPVRPGRPESARALEIARDGAGMTGAARLSMRADDLAPLVKAVVGPPLRSLRIRLRRLDLDLAQEGPDGLRVDASAAVRWRLLGASARGSALLDVSPDGIVTVRDLQLQSRHPVIAVALRATRRALRRAIGRTYDLNAGLADEGLAPRLHDVRVSVGAELAVSARLD